MADDAKKLGLEMLRTTMADQRERAHGGFAFTGARLDVNTTHTQDITPEAAKAMIEIAKQTHAVPAQEQTKQEIEVTKRVKQLTVQHVIVGGIVGLCAVLAFLNKDAGPYLAAMAAVMGGVYTVSLYVNKTPRLPSKGEAPNKQLP